VKIPLYSGSKAFWADETADAANGKGAFTHIALSPKRLAAQISISRRTLVQAPAGLETMLQNDLVNAIADALEATILGNGAGSDNTPKGIFNGASAVALTFENVVALEEGADAVNALTDNAQYLMSTSAWAKAKTTTKSESVVTGFILEPGNTMNGYAAKRSNNVKGIAFGDWSELVIGQWGDIVLDLDYQATTDSVVITINSMWDAAIRREGAIQAKTITE
jgi:HK97 family phage major capsid protein